MASWAYLYQNLSNCMLELYAVYCFPGGSAGKDSTSVQKSQVQSLGREDPLKKGMATHSSILAWRIPWTGEHEGLLFSMESQRVGYD